MGLEALYLIMMMMIMIPESVGVKKTRWGTRCARRIPGAPPAPGQVAQDAKFGKMPKWIEKAATFTVSRSASSLSHRWKLLQEQGRHYGAGWG